MRSFMEFLPIVVFAAVAVGLVLVLYLLSALLRPHGEQSETKRSPYECGEEPIGEPRMNFPYSYYIYAVIFAVVDVLAALLFMFAVTDLRFEVEVVLQAFVLIGVLMAGLVYGLSKISEVMLSGTEIRELWRASKKA